ncbi:zinc finger protein AZF2-like [Abeliophyllum distichum]|uniref:Zinc finger protein AZF2-like n=1 Tax=Abeliophyllum distichum TaxID=126358 RepID=A0ABD1TEI3_9LAMI
MESHTSMIRFSSKNDRRGRKPPLPVKKKMSLDSIPEEAELLYTADKAGSSRHGNGKALVPDLQTLQDLEKDRRGLKRPLPVSKALVPVPIPAELLVVFKPNYPERHFPTEAYSRLPMAFLPPKKRRLDSTFSTFFSLQDLPLKKRTLRERGYSSSPGFRFQCAVNQEMDSRNENALIAISNINQIQAQKQYVCNICSREFWGFRALGGHKAHCKKRQAAKEKDKSKNAKAVVLYKPNPSPATTRPAHHKKKQAAEVKDRFSRANAVVLYKPNPPVATRSYPCSRCGRNFSNGQALGGHKRHCRRPPPPRPINYLLPPQDSAPNNGMIVGIDVNEPAPTAVLSLTWHENAAN